MTLGEVAQKIRSKNAGPFWVSIDIFCEEESAFQTLCTGLKTEKVAKALDVPAPKMRRFEIDSLCVIKFSFPRSAPQGSRFDRDMHGAQFAHILADLEL